MDINIIILRHIGGEINYKFAWTFHAGLFHRNFSCGTIEGGITEKAAYK